MSNRRTGQDGAFRQLVELGALPTEDDAPARPDVLRRQQQLLEQIVAPVDDARALELLNLFPSDESDAFGLAWTLVHLVESAPGWPIQDAIVQAPPYWGSVLMARATGMNPERGPFERREWQECDANQGTQPEKGSS